MCCIGLTWPNCGVAQMRKHLGLEIEIKVVDAPTAVNTWVSGIMTWAVGGMR